MSCSRHFLIGTLLLAGSLLTGACGFHPLYTLDGSVPELAAVTVQPIADRAGQELRTELIDLLNPARGTPAERYRLAITLSEERESYSLERTGFASRANLRIEAEFTLADAATGATLFSGTSKASSSYDILDRSTEAPRDASKFSTLTADQAARSRIVRQLAQDIRRRLAVHFSRAPQPSASPSMPPPTT